ncbi:hypothetical protein GBAR_LOCUS7239, partial [Geodia barretti]
PAFLLLGALLQLPLQPTSASPTSWFADERVWAAQSPLAATQLIQDAKTFVQNGLNSLSGTQTVCLHLRALLSQLQVAGTITLSTTGPPSPDNSLLQHPEFWGNVVTIQHA